MKVITVEIQIRTISPHVISLITESSPNLGLVTKTITGTLNAVGILEDKGHSPLSPVKYSISCYIQMNRTDYTQ